jgi:hypothetical protein
MKNESFFLQPPSKNGLVDIPAEIASSGGAQDEGPDLGSVSPQTLDNASKLLDGCEDDWMTMSVSDTNTASFDSPVPALGSLHELGMAFDVLGTKAGNSMFE